MPLSDYSHWNEEAARIWWEEEGKHQPEPSMADDDFDDRDRYYDEENEDESE